MTATSRPSIRTASDGSGSNLRVVANPNPPPTPSPTHQITRAGGPGTGSGGAEGVDGDDARRGAVGRRGGGGGAGAAGVRVGGAAAGGAEAGGGPGREALLVRAPRRALLLRLGLPHRRPLLLEVHGARDPGAARQAAGRQRRHEPLRRPRRPRHRLRHPEARAPPRHPARVHAGVQEDAGEPELHEGARRPPQLRARRHHRVQGYRRHVAEGAFAPGEGLHSRQRQPDRRGNWAGSKHKSSSIQSEGLVWRCSGKSQAVGGKIPCGPRPPWRHQEEEIKGHDHSFSSNRGLHHLFDHLLALKMTGALLEKLAAGTPPLGTERLTGDNRWHDKRLGDYPFVRASTREREIPLSLALTVLPSTYLVSGHLPVIYT